MCNNMSYQLVCLLLVILTMIQAKFFNISLLLDWFRLHHLTVDVVNFLYDGFIMQTHIAQ